GYTPLALVRRDPVDGLAYPLAHNNSAMLRGLAQSVGFAVIAPGTTGTAGSVVPLGAPPRRVPGPPRPAAAPRVAASGWGPCHDASPDPHARRDHRSPRCRRPRARGGRRGR